MRYLNIVLIWLFICWQYFCHSQVQKFPQDSCLTANIPNEKGKDIELDLTYNQVNRGFIGIEALLAFNIAYGIGFYENAVSIGISPWKQSACFDLKQNISIGPFSLGIILGFVNDFMSNRQALYLKPNVLLDIKFFKISYGYSWLNSQNFAGYNQGHNLGVQVPIFSTCGFTKFKGERKQLKWGHAPHGMGEAR